MSLKAFFREVAIQPENLKVVISRRFLNEDGSPIEWELKAIDSEQNDKIKEKCTSKTSFKGRATPKFDVAMYNLRLAAATVISPDLTDAELQKNYGIVGVEALLGKMLLPGEMTELNAQVSTINGFELDQIIEDKEEVKNSSGTEN